MKEKFDLSLYEGGKEACEVVQKLQAAGYTAYFAGGCVRDMLMGRLPKDFDIASDCLPEQATELFPHTKEIGKSFGVVLVRHKGHYFEIATFREDMSYTDGRRPDKICFSNPQKDASRRDFTINAIFYDPISENLYDYVNGTEDIIRKLVRFVGSADKRIKEDHLRMLRAVRFGHTLGFILENETEKAIEANCSLVNTLSSERIRDELSRIICESKQAGDAVEQLKKLGLLDNIIPIFNKCPENRITAVYKMLNNISGKMDFELAMAIMLQFINMKNSNVGQITESLKKLKLSNAQKQHINDILLNIPRFDNFYNLPLSRKKLLLSSSFFRDSLKLLEQRSLLSISDSGNYKSACSFAARHPNFKLPESFLSGHDMIELGVKPGKELGNMLDKVYNAQLNERINSKYEAKQYVDNKVNQ